MEGRGAVSMKPIPATVEAVNELDPSFEPVDFPAHLCGLASQAEAIVPELVGVSIARPDHGLTFTLVATTDLIAVLDAIQYLAGGPCVHGAETSQVVAFDNDNALDEERWRLFAEATAAHAVRSTLTLPVVHDGRVEGTVNLYAGSPAAFVGHHEELAEIFGAWAAGAVANADLSFRTRREAQAAPRRVREQHVIDVAIGMVAARFRVDVDTAHAHLQDAAARA
jgi:GAF domain-containing protein